MSDRIGTLARICVIATGDLIIDFDQPVALSGAGLQAWRFAPAFMRTLLKICHEDESASRVARMSSSLDPKSDPLLNGTQLAKHLGVHQSQVTIWRQEGIIPAEISEGRCHRYDLERVREHLAKRAEKNAKKRRW